MPPARTIRLVRRPDAHGPGVACLTLRGRRTYYVFVEIPCAIGGRGFAMHILGLGTVYHVRIGSRDDDSCECLGFLRHGYCRHVLGLHALVAGERL